MQTTPSSYPYVWQYLPLVLQVLVALAVAGGMVGASFLIGKHKNSRTKGGAYECGMDPVGDARGRFSVRFYMVAMLFILFDVEAVFMLPWAVIFRRLPGITGSKMFGFWEMLVYSGLCGGGAVLCVEEGHFELGERQGRPVAMYDPASALSGTEAVFAAHPEHAGVVALARDGDGCEVRSWRDDADGGARRCDCGVRGVEGRGL